MAISVNKKISDAVEKYKSLDVPMKALITDFLAVKTKGSMGALNPWQHVVGSDAIEGVSVLETAYIKAAMTLIDQKPSDVIMASLYQNRYGEKNTVRA